MPLDCPDKLSSFNSTSHIEDTQQDTQPLGRLETQETLAIIGLGRRDGWDGGWGYASFPSRHWTLNCLLSRQRNRAQGKLVILCPVLSPLGPSLAFSRFSERFRTFSDLKNIFQHSLRTNRTCSELSGKCKFFGTKRKTHENP